MKIEKFGNTRKIRLLPNELLFNQGDEGNCAFLINQGNLDVIVDGKKVENLFEGELFGEMALILNQKRSASVVAKSSTELIEITKASFAEIMNEVSNDLKQIIQKLCKELSKRNSTDLIINKNELDVLLKNETSTVTALTRQIYFRLTNSTNHPE